MLLACLALPRLPFLLLLEVMQKALSIFLLHLECFTNQGILRQVLDPFRRTSPNACATCFGLLKLGLRSHLVFDRRATGAASNAAGRHDRWHGPWRAWARRSRSRRAFRLRKRAHNRLGCFALPLLFASDGFFRLDILVALFLGAIPVKVRINDIRLFLARLELDVVLCLEKHVIRLKLAASQQLLHAIAGIGTPRPFLDEHGGKWR